VVSNGCGTTKVDKQITVTDMPSVATIEGNSTVCKTGSLVLSNGTTGGVWSSDNTGVIMIDGSNGTVTLKSSGTATVSYVVSNGCGTTKVDKQITVTDVPSVATIEGNSTVCKTGSLVLSNATTGGVWSSDNTGVIMIDGSNGTVTLKSSGTATVSYVGSNGCGTTKVDKQITVTDMPSVATIEGNSAVCKTGSLVLSNGTTGGVWSSDNTGVIMIDVSKGTVMLKSSGTATVSYAVSNGCGTTKVDKQITVTDVPSVATIEGNSTVCKTGSLVLRNGTTSGVWSSDNTGILTIDGSSGNVTLKSSGTATVSYVVSNACGTTKVDKQITVMDVPSVSPITGNGTVCKAETLVLTNGTAGGIWSSDNTGVLTIDGSSGTVTVKSSGTATVSYTVSNACATTKVDKQITVMDLPFVAQIEGNSKVCKAETLVLSNGTASGVWSSDNTGVLMIVRSSGTVTLKSSGTATVSYTVSNACGATKVEKQITIADVPSLGQITGESTLCVSQSISLSNANPAGEWSSNNTSIATIDRNGLVTGITSGNVLMKYAVSNTCGSTEVYFKLNIKSLPVIPLIVGQSMLCVGKLTQFSNSLSGGYWTGVKNDIASIDSLTGIMKGISPGETVIKYSVNSACGVASVEKKVSISGGIKISEIAGKDMLCVGSTIMLKNDISNGSWSSSKTNIAVVNSLGEVKGISAGEAVITYTVIGPCERSTITKKIIVSPLPVINKIAGPDYINVKNSGIFSAEANELSGIWASSDNTVLIANQNTGSFTGLREGKADVTYTVTNVNQCSASLGRNVIVSRSFEINLDESKVTAFPNPAVNGTVRINAIISTTPYSGNAEISIIDNYGNLIQKFKVDILNSNSIQFPIQLNTKLKGVVYVHIIIGKATVIKQIIFM
jgi:uncharacterized protein YjdB